MSGWFRLLPRRDECVVCVSCWFMDWTDALTSSVRCPRWFDLKVGGQIPACVERREGERGKKGVADVRQMHRFSVHVESERAKQFGPSSPSKVIYHF